MAQSPNPASPKNASAGAAKAATKVAAAVPTPSAAPAKPTSDASIAKAPAGKTVSAGDRISMINEAAYFIAHKRGFVSGSPVQDWLTAEQQVDSALGKRS